MALQSEIDLHPQNAPRNEAHLDDYYTNVARVHARHTPEKSFQRTEDAIWKMWNGSRDLPPGFEDLMHERNFREFKAEVIRRIHSHGFEF